MNHDRSTSCAAAALLMIGVTSFVCGAPQRTAFSIPPEGEVHAAAAVLAAPQFVEPPSVEALRAKSDELTRRFEMIDYDLWRRGWQLGNSHRRQRRLHPRSH